MSAMAKQVQGHERADRYKTAAEAYGQAASIYKRLKQMDADAYKDPYYRNVYRWCAALFEYSEGFEQLKDFFKTMRGIGESPEWDGGRWKQKLNELEQAVDVKDTKKE